MLRRAAVDLHDSGIVDQRALFKRRVRLPAQLKRRDLQSIKRDTRLDGAKLKTEWQRRFGIADRLPLGLDRFAVRVNQLALDKQIR